MAVKIKINWENESVMSESVRIYRADSAFTSNSLPPLLAEVVGDIYEYEDLTTEKDETYFILPYSDYTIFGNLDILIVF